MEVSPEEVICECACEGRDGHPGDIAVNINYLKAGKVKDCGCGRGRPVDPSLKKKCLEAFNRMPLQDRIEWFQMIKDKGEISDEDDTIEEAFWKWSQWHGLSTNTNWDNEQWYWGQKPYKKINCDLSFMDSENV